MKMKAMKVSWNNFSWCLMLNCWVQTESSQMTCSERIFLVLKCIDLRENPFGLSPRGPTHWFTSDVKCAHIKT